MRNRSLSPTVSKEAMTASPTKRRAVGTGGRPILRTSDTLPGSPAKGLLFRTEESGGFGAGESEEYLFQSPVNPRPCSISATSSLQQQTEVPAKKSSEKTPNKRKPTKWQKLQKVPILLSPTASRQPIIGSHSAWP